MLKKISFLLMAVAVSATANAGPVTLDFNAPNQTTVWNEDGFTITPQAGDHFEAGAGWNNEFQWHDSTANNAPNILTLVKNGGGAFAALSLTLTQLPSTSGGVRFTDSNGNVVVANSTGNVVLNFVNTTFVKWQITATGTNAFPNAIDNVKLDTNPVPEPSTLSLLGLGVLGMAYGIRRRNRKQT